MLAAVARAGKQSLFRRFFGARREFSGSEIRFFVNVDFVDTSQLLPRSTKTETGDCRRRASSSWTATKPRSLCRHRSLSSPRTWDDSDAPYRLRFLERPAFVSLSPKCFENTPMLKIMEKSRLPMTTRRKSGSRACDARPD